MNDLIRILWDALKETELLDALNDDDRDPALLELAQQLAEAVVAAGWPRSDAVTKGDTP